MLQAAPTRWSRQLVQNTRLGPAVGACTSPALQSPELLAALASRYWNHSMLAIIQQRQAHLHNHPPASQPSCQELNTHKDRQGIDAMGPLAQCVKSDRARKLRLQT